MRLVYAAADQCNAEVGIIIGKMDSEAQEKYTALYNRKSKVASNMSMDARMVEHYEETLKGLSEGEQAIETEKLN